MNIALGSKSLISTEKSAYFDNKILNFDTWITPHKNVKLVHKRSASTQTPINGNYSVVLINFNLEWEFENKIEQKIDFGKVIGIKLANLTKPKPKLKKAKVSLFDHIFLNHAI